MAELDPSAVARIVGACFPPRLLPSQTTVSPQDNVVAIYSPQTGIKCEDEDRWFKRRRVSVSSSNLFMSTPQNPPITPGTGFVRHCTEGIFLSAAAKTHPSTPLPNGSFRSTMAREDPEKELARYIEALSTSRLLNTSSRGPFEELKTAPLFSWPVKVLADSSSNSAPSISTSSSSSSSDAGDIYPTAEIFPQYAVLGYCLPPPSYELLLPSDSTPPPSPPPTPIFLNTNAPWSAFVCGSQGSGKSYTLSCMLENCLLPTNKFGRSPKPLSGVLFHYDSHNSDNLCEAAYLGTHMNIKVLCSPSNFNRKRELYSNLPGTNGRVSVHPLLLKDEHLNTQRILNLMAFSTKEGSTPLYMEVLIKILREMATERTGSSAFNYKTFTDRLEREGFSKESQKGPLQLRLQLLESFMENGPLAKRVPRSKQDIFQSSPGCLTIVDLTDPFIDAASACVLFDIVLALFLEDRTGVGKVIALDEAHKFMDQGSASQVFTESLLGVIREQRHKGARVIISTQEPHIDPKLLDLCSMTFVHRFTSPEWLATLQRHLAGASANGGQTKDELVALFQEIVNLDVGESLMFAPSAMLEVAYGKALKLGMRHLKFITRPKITSDGGQSIMAGEPST